MGMALAGRLLDHDYEKTAKKHGLEINRLSGDNVSSFPIGEARLRSVWYPAAVGILATVGYGWTLKSGSVGHFTLRRYESTNV